MWIAPVIAALFLKKGMEEGKFLAFASWPFFWPWG